MTYLVLATLTCMGVSLWAAHHGVKVLHKEGVVGNRRRAKRFAKLALVVGMGALCLLAFVFSRNNNGASEIVGIAGAGWLLSIILGVGTRLGGVDEGGRDF